MATTAQVIDETQALLQSWPLDQVQSTTLTSSLTSNGLSFTYDGSASVATGINAGLIEIDRELIYVSNVDGSTATIPPWGRGFKSTVAVSHSIGTRVLSQPLFPRQKTLDAINQTIRRVFPDIFVPKSFETTTTIPVITYDLPDDARWVLSAKWSTPTGMRYWQDVKHWRVSAGLGTQFGDGLNGLTVDVGDAMMPGRAIQFLYATAPTVLVNEADDWVTATGMDEGLVDVIELGAAAQMVQSLEASRTQMVTVEQQARSQDVPPSAALTTSKYFDARFQERLKEERQSLQRLFPPRVTREWM